MSPITVQITSTTANGRSVARVAENAVRSQGGTRSTLSPSGNSVAAPISPPIAPQSIPSAKALPTEGEICVASVEPPSKANTSMSRPNGIATSAAQPSRASTGAPSVR